LLAIGLAAAALGARPPAPPPDGAALQPVGVFEFSGSPPASSGQSPDGLSGLTRVDGNRYVAVSDRRPWLHPLEIEVDRATGRIAAARLARPIQLKNETCHPLGRRDGRDAEGVAYDPATGSVWIAQEDTARDEVSSLARHSLASGCRDRLITPDTFPELAPFRESASNLGFESIARAPDGRAWWTANEEALPADGDTAAAGRGSLVRLVRFDRDLRPSAQFAYETDPIHAALPLFTSKPFISTGVSELLAIDHDTLLVLERAVGLTASTQPIVRIRIFRAEVGEATDVSVPPLRSGLRNRRYRPAEKVRLLELVLSPLGLTNFEGMAFGPVLSNGDRSLILIADNDEGVRQALYALRGSGLDVPRSSRPDARR
jgi:hypothetical protein